MAARVASATSLDIPDVPCWPAEQTYLPPDAGPCAARRWSAEGSAIANEHFDDPLPFNMDGRIAFGGGPYRGLDLALYDEDTPEKLEQLLDVLDEADYISMSSGRLWQSIPRLPMRYPVTTRYYELLFAEELGFEKAAEFHSYPRLFGIEFDDTWAEEQFTVYDHPKVLIYRKTDDYDRERVRGHAQRGDRLGPASPTGSIPATCPSGGASRPARAQSSRKASKQQRTT